LTEDGSEAGNSTGLIKTSFRNLAGTFTIAIIVGAPDGLATSA
jgi:hypothetical protein